MGIMARMDVDDEPDLDRIEVSQQRLTHWVRIISAAICSILIYMGIHMLAPSRGHLHAPSTHPSIHPSFLSLAPIRKIIMVVSLHGLAPPTWLNIPCVHRTTHQVKPLPSFLPRHSRKLTIVSAWRAIQAIMITVVARTLGIPYAYVHREKTELTNGPPLLRRNSTGSIKDNQTQTRNHEEINQN